MSSIAKGVFHGGLPWGMIAGGAVLAAGLIIADQLLIRRGSSFRLPVLAVAVGLYLPLELAVPILAGGLIAFFTTRVRARRGQSSGGGYGVLFASGLITGEALIGIVLAVPFALAQSAEIFAISPAMLGLSEGAFTVGTNVLGVAALALFTVWLYRVATTPDET